MQVSSGGCWKAALEELLEGNWCYTHPRRCLLVDNTACPRHSRARVGFLGLLRLLLQLLALDHPQLLGQRLGYLAARSSAGGAELLDPVP